MRQASAISRKGRHDKKVIFLLMFLILMYSVHVIAKGAFFAIVEDKEGIKSKVKNLKLTAGATDDKNRICFRTMRGNSGVFLPVNEIAAIEASPLEKDYVPIFVKFRDGRMDKFKIHWRHLTLLGESTYGKWRLSGYDIKSIIFTDSNWRPILASIEPKGEGVPKAGVDQILLKNGDIISGNVQNEFFTVKASYGDFKFDKPEIREIQFEGGGHNIDFVILKIGDKISGVVQEQKVVVRMVTGNETQIDKEKIKTITFKK